MLAVQNLPDIVQNINIEKGNFNNDWVNPALLNQLEQKVTSVIEKFDARLEVWEKGIESRRAEYHRISEVVSVYSEFKNDLSRISSNDHSIEVLENVTGKALNALQDVQAKMGQEDNISADVSLYTQVKLLIVDMLAMISDVLGLTQAFSRFQSEKLNDLRQNAFEQFEAISKKMMDEAQARVKAAKSAMELASENAEKSKIQFKESEAQYEDLHLKEQELNRENHRLQRELRILKSSLDEIPEKVNQALKAKIAYESQSYINKILKLDFINNSEKVLTALKEQQIDLYAQKNELSEKLGCVSEQILAFQEKRYAQEDTTKALKEAYGKAEVKAKALRTHYSQLRSEFENLERKLNQIRMPEMASLSSEDSVPAYSEKTLVNEQMPVLV